MNDDETLARMLEELPEDATPPALPERIYAVRTERPAGPTLVWVAPLLLAALVLLFALTRSPPPPDVVLASGETFVDGQLALVAPGRRIEVDGKAVIFVEPGGRSLRVPPHTTTEDPMNPKTFLAGLTGIAITITVYEGSALVRADAGAPITVLAGERTTFGAPGVATTAAAPRPAATPADRLAELEAELAATREELAREKFAGALARGQLQAGQGTPSAWPEDVPPAFTRERFEASVREQIADRPDLALTEVDCSEFPCLATLRYTGDDETMQWADKTMKAFEPWIDSNFPDANVSANHSRFRNDDQDVRFMTWGAMGGKDVAVDERLRFRMNEVVERLGEEIREGVYDPAP